MHNTNKQKVQDNIQHQQTEVLHNINKIINRSTRKHSPPHKQQQQKELQHQTIEVQDNIQHSPTNRTTTYKQ